MKKLPKELDTYLAVALHPKQRGSDTQFVAERVPGFKEYRFVINRQNVEKVSKEIGEAVGSVWVIKPLFSPNGHIVFCDAIELLSSDSLLSLLYTSETSEVAQVKQKIQSYKDIESSEITIDDIEKALKG